MTEEERRKYAEMLNELEERVEAESPKRRAKI